MHTGTRSVSLLWNEPRHARHYPGLHDLDFVVTHLPHERDLLLLTIPGRERPLTVYVVRVVHHMTPQVGLPEVPMPKPWVQTDAVHHVDVHVEPDPLMELEGEEPGPAALPGKPLLRCTTPGDQNCTCGRPGCPGF
jgi:hypothetical protein